jgi:hypothetical protein
LIRLGGDRDGGYVVPDDLDGVAACFSPGVDVTASFEGDLIMRGIRCHLADASVDGPPIAGPLVDFQRKFLGTCSNERFLTLDEWVNDRAPGGGDLILQMDIEGAEWPVLMATSDAVLRRFRIIVVELHSLDRLADAVSWPMVSSCLERLLQWFRVVHLHPNNCAPPADVRGIGIPPFLELTLHRKDRASAIGPVTNLPLSIDHKNVPGRPDVRLGSEWGPPLACRSSP